MTDEQLLADARDAFALCGEAESENLLAELRRIVAEDLKTLEIGPK